MILVEFPEFDTCLLEMTRQPTEDKIATISRAKGTLTFSANFQLMAVNPCLGGYWKCLQKSCMCVPPVVTKNRKRILGRLLNSIDLHSEVPRVAMHPEKLSGDRLAGWSEVK